VRAGGRGAAAPPLAALAAPLRDRAGRHQPRDAVQAGPLKLLGALPARRADACLREAVPGVRCLGDLHARDPALHRLYMCCLLGQLLA